MKMYLSIIGVAMAVIAAVNIACGTAAWYYILIATVWCTVLQFVFDGAVAFLIRITPDRLYPLDHPYFNVSDREMGMLKRLRVRHWKDKVWELGGIGGFSKKSLLAPDDPAYIDKFLVECHKGVITHRLCYPAGFLAMLTLPNLCSLTVALPVALVNLYLNILPTLVLRYNTPKLKALRKRLARRSPEKTPAPAINGL